MQAAGGIVDHADQVQFHAPIFQPGMLAGVPLNHFAQARAALPPGMNLLDPLPAGAPQFAFDHPSPNSFAPGMDVVFAVQILRCQGRTKSAINVAAQYLQRLLFDLLVQLAVGPSAPQSVYQR
jgi:hypothetical protein